MGLIVIQPNHVQKLPEVLSHFSIQRCTRKPLPIHFITLDHLLVRCFDTAKQIEEFAVFGLGFQSIR